jgi:hypothetical protein
MAAQDELLYAIEASPCGSTTLVVYGESVDLAPPMLRQLVVLLQDHLSAVEPKGV